MTLLPLLLILVKNIFLKYPALLGLVDKISQDFLEKIGPAAD